MLSIGEVLNFLTAKGDCMIVTVQNDAVVIFTIIGMALWVLFPIGMFISVSHVDKNTDQVIQLGHLRHHSEPDESFKMPERPSRKPHRFNLGFHFRKHLRH